jgi:hypothetical protein
MNRKDVLKSLTVGLSFAGIASVIARFIGFNQSTFTIFLYLYVLQAAYSPLKQLLSERADFSPDILHRLVIVAEGEEMKMRKVLTGEKYRVDGDIEKL